MHKFLTFIKEFRIPKNKELYDAKASFSNRQIVIFGVAFLIACISMVSLVGRINAHFMVSVPADGGAITEGIIGVPTLVNPVLSVSDADKDLVALVYSGLMRKLPDGSFLPDLAKSYTVSPDGMAYTFILKDNLKFQDGEPLTADDILFTIDKIKDPLIKSPRKIGWDGVTVVKNDDKTIVFTLKQPYISFLDNTTIGILPQHIWKNISATEFNLSTLNIKPTGSGPYKIDSVAKNGEGVPISYTLKRFTDFILGEPHISSVNIISYSNEKDLIGAMVNHTIDQASGISPLNAEIVKEAGYNIHAATLPRIFGMFYNNSANKIFNDAAVVSAFDKAIDRQEIVDKVLNGYATIIHSPVPNAIMVDNDVSKYKDPALDEAKDTLDRAGWKIGADGIRAKSGTTSVVKTKKVGKKIIKETVQVASGPITKLTFSLTTGDTPELRMTTALIKAQLEKLGAQIDIKVYETGPLNQLIRSRDYEALFFGQIVNHESDLFSFWHSSQKTDPGLNIAMYSNKNTDAILESAQKTLDHDARIQKYQDFVAQFDKDLPALLVYSPKYLYATSAKLNNISLDTLTVPSDRFVSIYNWYADIDHVWKIFTNSKAITANK